MKSALVLDGRYRVYEDGSIYRIVDGVEFPARTYNAGGRDGNGYLLIAFYENHEKTVAYVHRLVAEAFIPNPDGKQIVMHINGDKTNNAASNLRWATTNERAKYSYQVGAINKYRNAKPCIFCGVKTISKTGCCPKCLQKAKGAVKRSVKETAQAERYVFADLVPLTPRQAAFVEMAQAGIANADIARELGVSRQRIDQIAKQVERKQAEVAM